jgi:hypothetical protein
MSENSVVKVHDGALVQPKVVFAQFQTMVDQSPALLEAIARGKYSDSCIPLKEVAEHEIGRLAEVANDITIIREQMEAAAVADPSDEKARAELIKLQVVLQTSLDLYDKRRENKDKREARHDDVYSREMRDFQAALLQLNAFIPALALAALIPGAKSIGGVRTNNIIVTPYMVFESLEMLVSLLPVISIKDAFAHYTKIVNQGVKSLVGGGVGGFTLWGTMVGQLRDYRSDCEDQVAALDAATIGAFLQQEVTKAVGALGTGGKSSLDSVLSTKFGDGRVKRSLDWETLFSVLSSEEVLERVRWLNALKPAPDLTAQIGSLRAKLAAFEGKTPKGPDCFQWLKGGSCTRGDECKYAHTSKSA